ncbi:MAG: 23S rRNA (cytidine1920-2'-O)/16S rRNA (cytidine1409-2'-O)-methyltransferase [Anaerolineaceae bacterium]|nr:MAG: 23S rRNA (cytidine1920-2'-O)/16S rRNA (cytidine1409-2'-O)-methyltransferase [Anaerolineaceae bacterium]
MAKARLDILLVERGLAESRAKAQALVMAGQVRVDGQVVDRPASNFTTDANISVVGGPRFVSRGGDKLEAALTGFPVDATGRVCADVGSSTGGFTDCLLQHGAAKVYAIDVGKGLLHWKLRTDPRVVVMEETNARFVEKLPEAVSLVTIDASFISLKILLPVVKNWFVPTPLAPSGHSPHLRWGEPEGGVLALIKPQFEAGRKETAKNKGVIRDAAVHRSVLTGVLTFAQEQGFAVRGLRHSPVIGPKGNVEFLAWLGMGEAELDAGSLIEKIV